MLQICNAYGLDETRVSGALLNRLCKGRYHTAAFSIHQANNIENTDHLLTSLSFSSSALRTGIPRQALALAIRSILSVIVSNLRVAGRRNMQPYHAVHSVSSN